MRTHGFSARLNAPSRSFAIAAPLIVALAVSSCGGDSSTGPRPYPVATVAGRVLSQSNQPVAHANVRIVPLAPDHCGGCQGSSGITDAQGIFNLTLKREKKLGALPSYVLDTVPATVTAMVDANGAGKPAALDSLTLSVPVAYPDKAPHVSGVTLRLEIP